MFLQQCSSNTITFTKQISFTAICEMPKLSIDTPFWKCSQMLLKHSPKIHLCDKYARDRLSVTRWERKQNKMYKLMWKISTCFPLRKVLETLLLVLIFQKQYYNLRDVSGGPFAYWGWFLHDKPLKGTHSCSLPNFLCSNNILKKDFSLTIFR